MSEVLGYRHLEKESPTRRIVMGVIFVVLAAAIWLLFLNTTEPGTVTTFGLNPGRGDKVLSDWVVNANSMLTVLAAVCALIGGYQLARGFKKWTNAALGVVAALFIFGFLTWAAGGKSLNLAGLLATTLNKAVPLTIGALSGVLCESSGVVNIAIEGMMLGSAMVSALVASVTGNLWLGLLAGILTGTLLAGILAVLSIKYRVDQIIAGTMINILATGLTSYFSSKFMQTYQELNSASTFQAFAIPGLSKIPFIGPILFDNNIFVYVMYILLIVLQVSLFKTRWGLRVRAVGEHPKAADTLGINVFRTRYISVLLGGMMAGFGGAYFTLGSVGRFDEVMTAGRGFISLAAMIFGNYNPVGSFAASLLFGFADSLASRLAILQINIPSSFLLMAPYVATMVVLAGLVGKAHVPAADGTPYVKE